MSFSIPNEQAMNLMFSIAMPLPNLVHLYVNMSRVDLNAQSFSQFEDPVQCIDPDPESVAPAYTMKVWWLVINIGILE